MAGKGHTAATPRPTGIAGTVRLSAASPVAALRPRPAGHAGVAVFHAASESVVAAQVPAAIAAAAGGGSVTAAAGAISAAALTGLQSQLKIALNSIEQALEQKAFLESLPMIGSDLSTAFGAGQTAVAAFKTLSADITSNLQGVTTLTTAAVQTALNAAIQAAGFSGSVTVTSDGSGGLTFGFAETDGTSFSAALDHHFGLPGLNLTTSGSAQAALTWGLNLSGSVNAGGNLTIAQASNALALGVNLSAPGFGADATLGFLKYHAHDLGSTMSGTFDVGTSGAVTFTGSGATLDVGLTTDLGSASFPSFTTNLAVDWGFTGTSTVNPSNETGFGDTPTVTLSNVGIDFGSYVDNFLRPILDDLNSFIAPIQNEIDFFNQDITPLEDVLPDFAKNAIDENGIKDGRITLLDFMVAGGGAGAQLAQVINTLDEIHTLAVFFDSNSQGKTPFSLGSFTIPGDIRSTGYNPSTENPDPTGGSSDLTTFLKDQGGVGAEVEKTLNDLGLAFPILTDPTAAASLLLGGNADLATFTLNKTFGYGDVNDRTKWQSLFNLPLWEAPPVSVQLDAALSADFNVQFGFDTSGLKAFAAGGYSDPTKILNGLYVADPTVNGKPQPILSVGAGIGLALDVGVDGVASVNGGLDVIGAFNISLANGGRTYIPQILSVLQGAHPLQLFDTAGRVVANLDVNGELFGAKLFDYSTSPEVLYTSSPDSPDGLPAATVWAGGASGDFETGANWSPTFHAADIVPNNDSAGKWDVFSDCTIGAGATVTFNGPAQADLYSLQLAAGGTLLVQSGTLDIDGTSIASTIAGTVGVTGTGVLQLDGIVKNTGHILLGPGGLIGVSEIVDLTGGGIVVESDPTADWTVGFIPRLTASATSARVLLRNDDNTIEGLGRVDVAMENDATVEANAAGTLALHMNVTNSGLLAAIGTAGVGVAHPTIPTLAFSDGTGTANGQLIYNDGGTIEAVAGGTVAIGGGTAVTVHGGTLVTPFLPTLAIGVIDVGHVVTLDGGTGGMTVDATVGVVPVSATQGSLLTLAGTIGGTGAIASNGNNVELFHATIQGIVLNATAPQTGPGGIVQVESDATLDGGTAAVGIGDTLHVGAGGTLAIDGTIRPAAAQGVIEATGGTIVVGSAGRDAASLAAAAAPSAALGTLLLDGTGTVVTGHDASSVLTNGWTIVGQGTLGNGKLGIVNSAGAVIRASGTAGLAVSTGTLGLTNLGLLDSNGFVLTVTGNIRDAGGLIQGNGGFLDLGGGDVAGGALSTSAGGAIVLLGTGATLDGAATAITLDTGANIVLSSVETAKGTIVNGALLSLSPISAVARTLDISGHTSFTGLGSLAMAGSVVTAAAGGGTLDNVANVVSGSGQLGRGTMALIDEAGGQITASGGTLTIDTSGAATNLGQIGAAAGGTLLLLDDIANAGGRILANGGTVALRGITVAGGRLSAAAGGVFALQGSNTLDGTAQAVTLTLGAILPIGENVTLTLAGQIVDSGTIAAIGDASVALGNDALLQVAGTVTLSGGGIVRLGDSSGTAGAQSAAVAGAQGVGTLDIAGATVAGSGLLGEGELTLVNQAGGLVSASGGTLNLFVSGTVANTGVLRAWTGGTLDLQSDVANVGGTIAAAGGIVLLARDTVFGGTFAASGGGRVIGHGATLDGIASAITLSAGAAVGLVTGIPDDNSDELTLMGTIANAGTLFVISNANIADEGLTISGRVRLTGGGLLSLSELAPTVDLGDDVGGTSSGTDVLDNVNNTIAGLGVLGSTNLTITNEAMGVVSAAGGTLEVITLNNTVAGAFGHVVNQGTLRAAGGTLDLLAGIDNRGGTIAALPDATAHGGIVLIDGAQILGGLLATATANPASLILATTSGGTLDGTEGGVTLAMGARLQIADGASLTLAGTIANGGTISLQANSLAGDTATLMIAGTVRLTGGGRIALSDNPGEQGDSVVGAAAGATLANVDNTIAGSGLLGGGTLAISNGGLIEATVAATQLDIDLGGHTLTNLAGGRLLGAGGTLVLDNLALANAGIIGAGDAGKTVLHTTVTNGNLATGTLTGGTWSAVAAGRGATLDITGGTVAADAADIVLSGVGSTIGAWNGSAYQSIAGSLKTIAATGTLAVLGGRGYTTTLALTDAGQVVLAGGTFQAAGLTVAAGGTFVGSGTVEGTIADAGIVRASGGLLTLAGAVTGKGWLSILPSGTLELGAAAGAMVSLASGAGGMLRLDAPAQFLCPISGLAVGDVIDFAHTTAIGPAVNGTVLSVTVGGKALSFTVGGALAGNHFAVQSDSAGGTELILTAGVALAAMHQPSASHFLADMFDRV
jgi:hypothetical protein